MRVQAVGLIAKSVLIEAVRRKEIYLVVLVSVLLVGGVMTVDFFELNSISKFYREMALNIMSVASGLAVIVLSTRQLPREFENRTVHTLLARPISRSVFLFGKLVGVMAAAVFCFLIFMVIYVVGTAYLGGSVSWGLFLQFVYLQLLMMLILASLGFWLSMMFNFDAALSIGFLFFVFASTIMSMVSAIYSVVGPALQFVLRIMTFVIPQLTLFDLSDKAVHSSMWEPLDIRTMLILTTYGLVFVAVYFYGAVFCFRRKAI